MLRLHDVHLAIGTRDLLLGANWRINPGEKTGLVGRNGSGKSTLLRALADEHHVDGGRIERPPKRRLGYLHQHLRLRAEGSCWEVARSGMTRLLSMKDELEAAQQAASRHEDGAAEELGRVSERFRLAGGYAMDERVGEVLHGLGFSKEDWHRPVQAFSGGWQVRLALARMLLGEPDLLLLDEPTNHLDVLARGWLGGFLRAYPGAVVMVSHDRHLLDTACTRITEIRHQDLHHFKGGFSEWRKQRAERIRQQRAAWEAQQEEIARLERFIERFRYKPTKASQAMSRQKKLDKMERLPEPESSSDPVLHIAEAEPSGHDALVLEGAALGYDGEAVLDEVELRVERGMRLAVLGLNGSGKSTLLGALAGRLPLLSGRRRTGQNLRMGVLTQDLARDLPADRTPLEALRDLAPMATDSKLRGALGAVGLSGDAALRPIGTLSGGEKARVVLAGFGARPVNTLLLDEPTNHLDVVTVDVLIEALKGFAGAMVVVTHDRFLVEELATHVAVVHDGEIRLHEGVFPEDFELEPPRDERQAASEGAAAWEARKQRKRERQRLQRRATELTEEVEAAEARIEDIDQQLVQAGTDAERIAELAKRRSDIEAEIESLYERWAEVEAQLEG